MIPELFSAGAGRKRERGILLWNKEGLDFYYMVEKNWREVYNSKVQFLELINGWENWEPKDKSKKDTIWTYWTRDKEGNKKISSEKNSPQEKPWWEAQNKGYNSDLNLKAEYVGRINFLENFKRDSVMKKNERIVMRKGVDRRKMMKTAKLNERRMTKMTMMVVTKGTATKKQVWESGGRDY